MAPPPFGVVESVLDLVVVGVDVVVAVVVVVVVVPRRGGRGPPEIFLTKLFFSASLSEV